MHKQVCTRMKSISVVEYNVIIYDLIELIPESCTILQTVTQLIFFDGHQVYYLQCIVYYEVTKPRHFSVLAYFAYY